VLYNAFDRAVLPGRITALKDNQDPVAVLDDVPLDFYQLNLQVM
jgi:hypothetical protein